MFYSDKVEKIQLIISYILLAVLVISIFSSVYTQNWTVLFVSGLALILIFLPTMAGKRLGVRLPTEFKFIFLLFIYGALFLGDIHGYYEMFWWWDLVLHFFRQRGWG